MFNNFLYYVRKIKWAPLTMKYERGQNMRSTLVITVEDIDEIIIDKKYNFLLY